MDRKDVCKLICGIVIQIIGWMVLRMLLEVLGINSLYFVFVPIVLIVGIGIGLSVY